MSAKIFGLPSAVVFWLMFGVLVYPSSYFIFNSFEKLDAVINLIEKQEKLAVDHLLSMPPDELKDFTNGHSMAAVALERDTIMFRQQRTAAALITRTWLRFMSLIFGCITVVIGSVFVLGKVTSKDPIKGEAGFGDLKGSIATSSPGLLLVLIGACLITIPHFTHQPITSMDGANFVFSDLAAQSDVNPAPMSEHTEEYLKVLSDSYTKTQN